MPGRRTPTFTDESVPPALLKDHRTSAWAELIVTAGSVRFEETESRWAATATPGKSVVIVPDQFHHIEPDAAAEFYVQFYDLTADEA